MFKKKIDAVNLKIEINTEEFNKSTQDLIYQIKECEKFERTISTKLLELNREMCALFN